MLSAAASQHHAPGVATAGSSLPLDITIETIVATLVTVLGLVLGTAKLRPIQWHVWAGKVEREGGEGFGGAGGGEVDRDFRGNPFGQLESRPGFVDIRKQRREFAKWAREDKKA